MNVENDRFCFVCGKDNAEGLQVTPAVDSEQKAACLKLVIPRKFQGWSGIAHGGILSTLFDEAAIYSCLDISPQLVTAEITMRYLKPVPVEVPIEVRARLVKHERRRLHVEGEIEVAGQVCARGEAVVMILRETS